jgi:hypothetical protein
MNIEKLRKEDFTPNSCKPLVRVYYTGEVYLNRLAVEHLGLRNGHGYLPLSICHDKDPRRCGDFFIMRDDEGWCLIDAPGRGAKFYGAKLTHLIIDSTWNNVSCHPAGVSKPKHMTFIVARLPVDDDKNKDVFALLRNKQ